MITSEIETKIRYLKQSGIPRKEISQRLQISFHQVRKTLEVNYVDRLKSRNRTRFSIKKFKTDGYIPPAEFNPIYCPNRDGIRQYRSFGAFLMGDPPVGRSALEQRS